METINKKELSEKLRKALAEEHLWAKDAAQLLNMNPIYVSMMLNSNSFDKAGSSAWNRLNEWAETGDKILNYKFPDGEEIWKPKEKTSNIGSFADIITKPGKSGEKAKNKSKENLKSSIIPVINDEKENETKANSAKKFIKAVNQEVEKRINLSKSQIKELSVNDAGRIKVVLDIEINLIMNGQRVQI